MDSRALTPSDISWVVRIMYENPDLVESRERICMGLGLSMSELTDIIRAKPCDTRGFLALALNSWISKFPVVTFAKLDEALKTENFNSTADRIRESLTEYPPNTNDKLNQNSSVPNIWFDVPEDVNMFTGRVEDMNELHASIVSQNLEDGKNDMTVITAVCGLGGVGKTSLTIHYAWTFFNIFYVNVIWINSETKNSITASFTRLARKQNIQNISLELCDIVSGIYESLGKAKTLIIFDNVECYEDIKSYIPVRSPNAMRPHVLLTSRRRNWHSRTHLIDLNVFRTDESIDFIKLYLCLTTEEELEQAEIISNALQNLPLAIRQAGAYIKVQQRENEKPVIEGLKSYVDLFNSNSVEALKFDYSSHTADIYEKTIFSTWTVNMDYLTEQNRLTRTIIEVISYLNPDNIPIKLFYYIPKWLLEGGFINRVFNQSCVEMTDVNSAIKLLADFSLIRLVGLESFSVHRLLQTVVRTQVQQKYKDSQFDWITILMRIPLQSHSYDHDEDIYLLHALSIREHIPTHCLRTSKVKSFLELIDYKQNNSVSNNLKLIQNLMEQDKFDNALESYERCKKLYTTSETSTRKSVDKEFTLLCVNIICLEICKYVTGSYESINARSLKLCEIIKDLLRASNISLDMASNESLQVLGQTVRALNRTTAKLNSVEHNETKMEVFSVMYFIHNILYGRMETSCHYPEITRICCTMFDCLIEMREISEIKRFLESLSILLDHIVSRNSDSELHKFQKAANNFLKKLSRSDILSSKTELFVPMFILQRGIYNFYKNKNTFYGATDAVICGPGLIECKLKIENASQVLKNINDLQRDLSKLVNSNGFKKFLRKEVHVIPKLSVIYNALIGLINQFLGSSSPNTRNELILLSLNFWVIKYEFEKLTFSFRRIDSTIQNIVECYIQLDRVEDIINLSVEFQEVVAAHFEHDLVEQVKQMAGLSEVLLRKGRGANHLIKYPDLIAESMKISRKWYEVAVREEGDENFFSLIHFHCINICELLLEPNVNKLLQYSENLYTFADKHKHIKLYALILIQGGTELRHARQFDKATECLQLAYKMMAGSNGEMDSDLCLIVQDDKIFESMASGLTMWAKGYTSDPPDTDSDSDFDFV